MNKLLDSLRGIVGAAQVLTHDDPGADLSAWEQDWRKRELTLDGESSNFGAQLAWAGIATVANLPSTAVPLGVNKAGLPLSVQVIGPFLEDKTTIAFAKLLNRECPLPALAN